MTFANLISEAERADLLLAYLNRMTGEDESIRMEAIRGWVRHSASCLLLFHDLEGVEEQAYDETSIGMATLDAWCFLNHLFVEEDPLSYESA